MGEDLRAFITGSYAYGSPRPDSDIDLVVLASAEVIQLLEIFTGSEAPASAAADPSVSASVRFEALNLILVGKPQFLAWQAATQRLVRRAKQGEVIDRATAVTEIRGELDRLEDADGQE